MLNGVVHRRLRERKYMLCLPLIEIAINRISAPKEHGRGIRVDKTPDIANSWVL